MSTSHGSPPPGTCHADLSTAGNNLNTGQGPRSKHSKATQSKTTRANIPSNDSNASAQVNYQLAINKSPS